MVGAVTTLIVIVAVFLAYNANNGLPFVPVYRVSVEIPDAARLTNNNEVRIGGDRVGVVESIDAIQSDEATTTAQAERPTARAPSYRRRDRAAQPEARQDGRAAARGLDLPRPLPLLVRPQVPGDRPRRRARRRPRASPSTAPTTARTCDAADRPGERSRARSPTRAAERLLPGADRVRRHQQHLRHRDADATRARTSRASATPSPAAAPRSTTRSTALEPLFRGLQARSPGCCSSPTPSFGRFFPELGRRGADRRPGRRAAGRLLHQRRDRLRRDLLRPGGAAGRRSPRAPPTLETGIEPAARASAPSCATFAMLARELRPGVDDLRATLPVLNEAIEVGTPVLRDSPPINRDLRGALGELNQLVTQPTHEGHARSASRRPSTRREPLAEWVVPAQTVCNYWNYWFTYLPERRSPTATRSATRSARCWPSSRARPRSTRSADRLLGHAGRTASSRRRRAASSSRTRSRSSTRTPTGRPGSRTPTARAASSATRSAQLPVPGQRAVRPRQPRLRPARLARADDGCSGTTTASASPRRHAAIDSRQPETWKGVGRVRGMRPAPHGCRAG